MSETPWVWDEGGSVLRDAEGAPMLENVSTGPKERALIASAPTMLAMLEELEWEGQAEGGIFICPICRRLEAVGHAPDCRLDLLLADLGKP